MLRDRLLITVLGAFVAVASIAQPAGAQQAAVKSELLISLSIARHPRRAGAQVLADS